MRVWLFCIIVCGWIQSTEVTSFFWDERDQTFVFSGNTTLPPRSKVKATLVAQQQEIQTLWFLSKTKKFDGYFLFRNKVLFPSRYSLHIELFSTNATVTCSKTFVYKKSLWEKSADGERASLLSILEECRSIYDTSILLHYHNLWNNNASTAHILPKKLQSQRNQIQQLQQKYVCHPFNESIKKINNVLQLLARLQFSIKTQVQEGTLQLFPFVVSQNICTNANLALQHLNHDIKWHYPCISRKEQCTLYEKAYRSNTSKFRYVFPKIPKNIVKGKQNSSLRTRFLFKNWHFDVHMIVLPSFIEKQHRIKAAKLILAYEWQLYAKENHRQITNKKYNKPLYLLDVVDGKNKRAYCALALRKNTIYILTAQTTNPQLSIEDFFIASLQNFHW